jgi:adenylate cyclase
MDFQWEWVGSFGSLSERDRFLTWMRRQIKDGMAEEIEAPAGEPSDAGDRWFRHIPTGSLWRLISNENPNGPGFWPAHVTDKAA